MGSMSDSDVNRYAAKVGGDRPTLTEINRAQPDKTTDDAFVRVVDNLAAVCDETKNRIDSLVNDHDAQIKKLDAIKQVIRREFVSFERVSRMLVAGGGAPTQAPIIPEGIFSEAPVTRTTVPPVEVKRRFFDEQEEAVLVYLAENHKPGATLKAEHLRIALHNSGRSLTRPQVLTALTELATGGLVSIVSSPNATFNNTRFVRAFETKEQVSAHRYGGPFVQRYNGQEELLLCDIAIASHSSDTMTQSTFASLMRNAGMIGDGGDIRDVAACMDDLRHRNLLYVENNNGERRFRAILTLGTPEDVCALRYVTPANEKSLLYVDRLKVKQPTDALDAAISILKDQKTAQGEMTEDEKNAIRKHYGVPPVASAIVRPDGQFKGIYNINAPARIEPSLRMLKTTRFNFADYEVEITFTINIETSTGYVSQEVVDVYDSVRAKIGKSIDNARGVAECLHAQIPEAAIIRVTATKRGTGAQRRFESGVQLVDEIRLAKHFSA